MKSEMDVMKLDERQRGAWLLANRATLFVVGAVWIGMIVEQMLAGRPSFFMLAMVPVFALVRFAFYRYYARVSRGQSA